MSLYDKCKKAEGLAKQAALVFGEGSDYHRRARAVQSYWYNEWQNRGGGGLAPSAAILSKRIFEAEREVEKDKARS